jgi:multimeric flavodoxin WrbA
VQVLAIVASPRKEGLVNTMAQQVLDGASSTGHQVELVTLYDRQHCFDQAYQIGRRL